MSNSKTPAKKNDCHAVIFDMDGLLLDSEKIAWLCFSEIAARHGHQVDFEVYVSSIGTDDAFAKKILMDEIGSSDEYDQIHLEYEAEYQQYVSCNSIPLKEGVVELLDWLKLMCIPTGLASSSRARKIDYQLKKHKLDGFFSHMISCEILERGKPSPDVYLHTMDLLGVADPQYCYVIEDSNMGVIAGLEAGANVIQIPDMVTPSLKFKEFPQYLCLQSLLETKNYLNSRFG